MTRTGSAGRPPLRERAESFSDWVRLYSREAIVGVIAVAAIAGGAAFYNWSQEKKGARAEQALAEAQRSVTSGNAPLARADLEKLVQRYDGTPAANQGTLLLAQLMFDAGKPQDGIKLLERLEGERDARALEPSIQALIAAGYEQLGKPAEAAERYKRAAAAAEFDLDKANLKASAARAYTAAGKPDAARELWTELAGDPSSAMAGEARVRLGELTAQPVKRS